MTVFDPFLTIALRQKQNTDPRLKDVSLTPSRALQLTNQLTLNRSIYQTPAVELTTANRNCSTKLSASEPVTDASLYSLNVLIDFDPFVLIAHLEGIGLGTQENVVVLYLSGPLRIELILKTGTKQPA